MSLVSIVIPIYNAENFIEKTLLSLISQTYGNLEIICVNDGSTDNSLKILQKYQDKIKIIDQENKGQCTASNSGLRAASGDYIKFFDADDIMNPEHIELQVKRLNGRQDAIASCEWGRFYDGNPESARFIPEPVWQDMKPLDWIKTALAQKADMMGAWLWLIPRQIIEKAGGWDERLSLNNDFEFSTRILLHSTEVLFTPDAKVYYRSGLSSNLASSKSELSYRAALLSTHLGCEYLLKEEKSSQIKLLCANRYQEWVYRMYPKFPHLVKEAEAIIQELGGSNKDIEGGVIFSVLKKLLGWKFAKKIQFFVYRFGLKSPFNSTNYLTVSK